MLLLLYYDYNYNYNYNYLPHRARALPCPCCVTAIDSHIRVPHKALMVPIHGKSQ